MRQYSIRRDAVQTLGGVHYLYLTFVSHSEGLVGESGKEGQLASFIELMIVQALKTERTQFNTLSTQL